MYKLIGSDGKEYGPISLEQLLQWIAQGRVNARTKVQGPASADWKMASEFPELSSATAPGDPGAGAYPQAPPIAPSQTAGQTKGMAVTSLVLGLVSLVPCVGGFTGIPAVICGHVAHSRSRRSPAQFGGGGLAIAGLTMGYFGILVSLLVVVLAVPGALLMPALFKAKAKAQQINCMNNLKQVGLAFNTWAIDHTNQFTFNVSTNLGGTLELCVLGSDGFDGNAALHFQAMSNELSTPIILVCPGDSSKRSAFSFQNLQSVNVSYQLYSGTNIDNAHPQAILAVCPIHGTVLLCDGSVQLRPRARR